MNHLQRMIVGFFLLGIPYGFAQEKKSQQEITLHFENESSTISTQDIDQLNQAIQQLEFALTAYSVTIAAHTDSNGSIGYNDQLSARRARASVDFLVHKGFLSHKISFVGRGESSPASDNISEKGRAQNRRAVIKICLENDTRNAIGGFTIREKTYSVTTQKPQEVTYESGTVIRIPENAFVDKNGNPVTGNVQLSYLEYRDPVDFILGNIPMDHTEGGEQYHFNSAGMFKIQARKENEEVFLGEGKNIALDFKLTQTLPNLNFYEFDPKANQWKEIRKLPADKTDSALQFIDLGYYTEMPHDTIAGSSGTGRFYTNIYDNDCQKSFRFLTIGLSLSKSDQTIYSPSLFVPDDSLKAYQGKRFVNDVKIRKSKNKQTLLNKQQLQSNAYCTIENGEGDAFSIDITNIPGLKMFKTMVWKGKHSQLKNSNKNLVLSQIKKMGDGKYQFHFNDADGEYVLDDIQLLPGDRKESEIISVLKYANTVLAAKDSKKERFQTLIDQQKADVEKMESDNSKMRKTLDAEAIVRALNEFWEFSKTYMGTEELALGFKEWLQYFDGHKPEMLERYTAMRDNAKFSECYAQEEARKIKAQKMAEANQLATTVTENLNINKLGIYNCDQIQRLQEPLIVNAEYQNEEGRKIIPMFIYIVDKSINGILRYDGYNGYGPERFAFSPKSKTTLIAFDGEGNAYVCPSEKMATIATKASAAKIKLMVSQIASVSSKQQLVDLLN